MTKKVLLLGCSTIALRIIQKGVDSFTKTEYTVGAVDFRAVLEARGYQITHVLSGEIAADMPRAVEALRAYDAVVISDVGSNTFLLSPVTASARIDVDRLAVLADYVRGGGGLLLVGGYLAFSGFEAKARYGATALAPILPVELLAVDDRVEAPAGITPEVLEAGHALLAGVPGEWPALLGYNRTVLRPGATELVRAGADPLLALGEAGGGRVVTFMSEFAPHWAPREFLDWDGYGALWANVIEWLAPSAERSAAGAADRAQSADALPADAL